MSDEVLSGSCLCGAVAYKVRAPFLRFAHCHCGRCRKATGTGHASNIYVDPANFEWVAGHEFTKRFDLPSARSFGNVWRAAGVVAIKMRPNHSLNRTARRRRSRVVCSRPVSLIC
jgi:Glutathione-dependent formaldehyde-activating enzyme